MGRNSESGMERLAMVGIKWGWIVVDVRYAGGKENVGEGGGSVSRENRSTVAMGGEGRGSSKGRERSVLRKGVGGYGGGSCQWKRTTRWGMLACLVWGVEVVYRGCGGVLGGN